MAKKDEFGPGKEFFSEWHRDQHVADLERELAGAERRLAELEAIPDASDLTKEQQQAHIDGVKEQLKRLGGHRGAAKRPTGGAKETR